MKAVGLGVEGNKPKASLGRYARGGAVKGKGTNVNIVISPPAAAPSAGMPPSIMPPPHVPQPGPAPAPPMPPGAAPGMPPGMPGGMPPGMMHKHGGRAYKKGGAVKLDAAAAVHKHEKHLHKGEKETKFARGGKVGEYTAGAASGDGRLQKVANYGKKAKANIK
jgi:hypothetical protein